MRAPSVVVYDLEIERCIPGKDGLHEDGLAYCSGWGDHVGMGISVLAAIELPSGRPRVFMWDNRDEAQRLLQSAAVLVGFNSVGFDNKVLRAAWDLTVPDGACFDLLREMWVGAGLGPTFSGSKNTGYGLDATAARNLRAGKTGHGELAPVQWQRGRHGSVVDYCLADVWLTAGLWQVVAATGGLQSPKDPGTWLDLTAPLLRHGLTPTSWA